MPLRPTSLDTSSPLTAENDADTTQTVALGTVALNPASFPASYALNADGASTTSASSLSNLASEDARPPSPQPSVFVNPWPSDLLRPLLTQQLQQHVQLLAQSFIMCKTCAKPTMLSDTAVQAKQLINEIHAFATQSGKGKPPLLSMMIMIVITCR